MIWWTSATGPQSLLPRHAPLPTSSGRSQHSPQNITQCLTKPPTNTNPTFSNISPTHTISNDSSFMNLWTSATGLQSLIPRLAPISTASDRSQHQSHNNSPSLTKPPTNINSTFSNISPTHTIFNDFSFMIWWTSATGLQSQLPRHAPLPTSSDRFQHSPHNITPCLTKPPTNTNPTFFNISPTHTIFNDFCFMIWWTSATGLQSQLPRHAPLPTSSGRSQHSPHNITPCLTKPQTNTNPTYSNISPSHFKQVSTVRNSLSTCVRIYGVPNDPLDIATGRKSRIVHKSLSRSGEVAGPKANGNLTAECMLPQLISVDDSHLCNASLRRLGEHQCPLSFKRMPRVGLPCMMRPRVTVKSVDDYCPTISNSQQTVISKTNIFTHQAPTEEMFNFIVTTPHVTFWDIECDTTTTYCKYCGSKYCKANLAIFGFWIFGLVFSLAMTKQVLRVQFGERKYPTTLEQFTVQNDERLQNGNVKVTSWSRFSSGSASEILGSS